MRGMASTLSASSVSSWVKLATRNPLAARFASNATRQAIGAGLFFATTLLLSHSLGSAGYTLFFRDSNAAILVAIATEFGLYADILRRLVLRHSAREVARALWRVQAAQLAAVAVIAWLASRLSDYDGWLILTVAYSQIVGNLLNATALGRDRFRTFMVGELTYNGAFLLLVAAVAPHEPRSAGYLIAGSAATKCAVYAVVGLVRLGSGGEAPPSSPETALAPGYARYTYAHSLAMNASYRGLFVIIGWVLTPIQLDRIALPWSLCDRALVLVQGICLVLQPRLIAGGISERARKFTYAGTVAAFIAVAVTMCTLAYAWALWRGTDTHSNLASSLLLCVAFAPHVLRLLRLSELAAVGRFRLVFASHVAAILAVASVAPVAHWVGLSGIGFAIVLVSTVSLAGLLALQMKPAWASSAK